MDNDIDTDTDIDTDIDTDLDIDTDIDVDTDTDDDVPDRPVIIPTVDPSIMYIQRKIDMADLSAIDKRQYMRFNVSDSTQPVLLETSNSGINSILDISRGGIAVGQDNTLQVGDVVPVHLTYGDLDIDAEVKIVATTDSKAGAQFVNLDPATANKLLYLNLLLEDAQYSITLK